MSYRPVDETFWTDPKVRAMSQREKLMFLYLITNPHANFSGVYYLPFPTLMFETGYGEKDARDSLAALAAGDHVIHDEENSMFWIVKMARHQVISEKQVDGVRKHFKTLQNSGLLGMFAKRYPDIVDQAEYPIDTLSVGYGMGIDTLPINRNKTETETKQKQPRQKKAAREIDQEFLDDLAARYPRVNIENERALALEWIEDHPGRKMSRSFLRGWIDRTAKRIEATNPQPVDDYDGPFLNRFEEESDRAGRWIVEQLEKDDEMARLKAEEEKKRNANNAA